jgi:hypothetical protein
MSERDNYIDLDDGRMVRVTVDGPVVTIWAYKETTSPLLPRPSWVVAGEANIDDYAPPMAEQVDLRRVR